MFPDQELRIATISAVKNNEIGSANEDYDENSTSHALNTNISVFCCRSSSKMSKTDEQKTVAIIHATEEVADVILMNKQELVELDKRKQTTRQAIREIEKSCAADKKVWTTIGSMLVKMKKETAMKLLKNDQVTIDAEINKLRSEQKILVNKHRDLEHLSPYTGTNLKALDRQEFGALKANLPIL